MPSTETQEWLSATNKALLESQDRLGTRLRQIHVTAMWAKDQDKETMASTLASIADHAVKDEGPYGRMARLEHSLRKILLTVEDVSPEVRAKIKHIVHLAFGGSHD